ncbi:preprotein translocase subunit SecY [Gottschalkia acidurici 9a]|uniref:Protein translocase subunit SecY n=1 Tax=Gottschalkia acidurici (strain ATCC 7906 / DSM 604 / BCRC 14475 / CIP 104303 / KCTC 5404 / NCIMB 10678 / 9a) TaxID=1128398 RepID=K0B3T1_GOTA9|nr:preprotein translocase subunit SecY [Gottschalkia acidurici]AFS79246.1 preprotein translocase subunit SecY [Gottschalkia acidurici 9a]
MLSTLKNAWKVPELRKKMIFTLMMLFIYRVGSSIPVPGINGSVIAQMFDSQAGGLLDFINLMAGGAFKNFTIFALNIYPYITASIILQLLTIAIPSLEELSREGEEGRKKISQYTKYLTIVLAAIQAAGISIGFFRQALIKDDFLSIAVVIIVLTAGTAFLMWLGEQITEKGVGNGISLLIFVGIVSRAPEGLIKMFSAVKAGQANIIAVIAFLIIALAIIVGVIMIQEGQRKIPVQYAKRVVGRKVYGGQSTHIPMKVLMAGVIPVIFSTSLLQFPQIIALFFKGGFADFVNKYLSLNGTVGVWIYSILNVLLIIFFTYFYTAIQFNPIEYSNNLKQNGGFIPGIRPGKPTSDYLSKVVSRITLAGAIALAIIATLPVIIEAIVKLNIHFGGTGILIVVGVVIETVKQLEAQMLMRHYKGFLNK